MHTPGDLHPALRRAWGFAEQVRAALLERMRPLTAAQWIFRPAARAWCIGEQVEHLLLAEIGSSKMVRKLIRGDFSAQGIPVGAGLHTAALDRYPFGRLEAPSVLVPGPVRNREILERALPQRTLRVSGGRPGNAASPGPRDRRLVHPRRLGEAAGLARGAPFHPDPADRSRPRLSRVASPGRMPFGRTRPAPASAWPDVG